MAGRPIAIATALGLSPAMRDSHSRGPDEPTLQSDARDSVAIGGMVMTTVAAILAIQVVRRIAARQEQCLRAQQAAWGMAPPTTTW